MKRLLSFLYPVLMLCLLGIASSCSVLPPPTELRVFLLPASSPSPAVTQPKHPVSLRISQPQSNQFLNTSRIAVQPQGNEITVYKGVRWSDATPLLLRNRLLQAFRNQPSFSSVSSDEDNVQNDFELSTVLTAFQGVYHGKQAEVMIQIQARLIETASRKIVAQRSIEIRHPIDGSTMEAVVSAFGHATDQLSKQLTDWVSSRLNLKQAEENPS